jgi:hypothetical protein
MREIGYGGIRRHNVYCIMLGLFRGYCAGDTAVQAGTPWLPFYRRLHSSRLTECTICSILLNNSTVLMDLWFMRRNAFDAGKSITRARGKGVGPCAIASSLQASAIWGPTPSTCPSTGFARIKCITYRAVSIRGPLVVLCTWASRAHGLAMGESEGGQCSKLKSQNLLEINRNL